MVDAVQKIAVYTTVYPGVEAYLPDWYRSVQAQTDQEFELWIGLDNVEAEAVQTLVGTHFEATWVSSARGDTPAQIRQRSLAQIVKTCDAVVLVDSDDILHESRVAAARSALDKAELYGCALRLVNQQGRELRWTFGLPPEARAEDILPRYNIFGMSNTAYRSELLRRCLPVPAGVALVDWFLATKAWLLGARLAFDPVVRMDYRQHGNNMARVRFPVSAQQVTEDTELVRRHFRFILAEEARNFLPGRLAQVNDVAAEIEAFQNCVIRNSYQLQCYVEALNRLNPAPVWWASVAHPELAPMWRATLHINYESC